MSDMETDVAKSAIAKWGKQKQLDMAIEELSEMTKTIVKYRRYDWNAVWRLKVLDEVADVEQMCLQMRIMLSNKKEYDEIKRHKLENLQKIIKNDDPMRGLKFKDKVRA